VSSLRSIPPAVSAADDATIPDAQAARASVRAWAGSDAVLGALILRGVPMLDALQRWAAQLLKGGRVADAVLAFRVAVALSPKDPDAWTHFAVALDRYGSHGAAGVALAQALAIAPDRVDAWVLLGLVRQKSGDRTGAEAAYREAVARDPGGTAAWQCLGVLKQEQRAYVEAIGCFQACVERGDESAAVFANIGKLSYQTCRVAQAHDAYRRASSADPANPQYRRMVRNTRFVLDVMDHAPLDAALAAYEAAGTDASLRPERDLAELFEGTCGLLATYGHLDAALRASKKRAELWPTSASAQYLLRALGGDAALDRSPPEYIVESFDAFAAGFDAKLVGALGYDVPEKLCAAVREVMSAGPVHDVLDAGCGTGLCGPALRAMARTLAGVDLSSKMIELAGRRGVYDELVREELVSFLTRSEGRFDLIVAADVMIYFGDLAPVFAAAARAIRPGGVLGISTERETSGGFRLRPSGRFAHEPGYVEHLAGEVDFTRLTRLDTTIRLDGDARVAGNLFAFRRR
jgi:predicted TPR repeat methyltransferase